MKVYGEKANKLQSHTHIVKMGIQFWVTGHGASKNISADDSGDDDDDDIRMYDDRAIIFVCLPLA